MDTLDDLIGSRVSAYYGRAVKWIDAKLFPAVMAYAVNRLHILGLLCLGVVLMISGDKAGLELVGGNYTNITAALMSCIMVWQAIEHRKETAHLHRKIDALHDKVEAMKKPATATRAKSTKGA